MVGIAMAEILPVMRSVLAEMPSHSHGVHGTNHNETPSQHGDYSENEYGQYFENFTRTAGEGGNQAHSHGIQGDGSHSHGGSTGGMELSTVYTSHLPNYVALHFIIRLW